jgi:hypothetical protein
MNKELLNRIEELFKERLSTKTSWGRDQVLLQYQSAVSDALTELLDKYEEQNR